MMRNKVESERTDRLGAALDSTNSHTINDLSKEGIIMTSRKFSRKRIGQALGLLALGLVLLVGKQGYGLMPTSPGFMTSALVECKVTITKGEVSIKRVSEGSDVWEELKPGARVNEGDEIITNRNSWVLIVCGCVQVFVKPDSHAKLDRVEPTEGDFSLLYGVSLSKLKRCPVGTLYRVRSPHGMIGVRGTLFQVGYDPKTELDEVIVVEGTVEIATLPTGKNQLTLTGPGSCDQGGLRVTLNKDEEISEPQLVPINREEWRAESDEGKKIDFCAP